jgi:four helix bundle protein
MKNSEFKRDLEQRTKLFAVELIDFLYQLSYNRILNVLVCQVVKSGTSIGANYREANRAELKKDFIHKIGIVEKEASETVYWLELLAESKALDDIQEKELIFLHKEAEELLALFSSISRSGRGDEKTSAYV